MAPSTAPTLGADAKIGIGTGLTVDATVNPDFGQVEVDPAVVNLSDVETFFDEKRPFFVEGSSLFNFGYGGASNFFGFNFPNPNFFYSRRIGRAPQGSLPDYDYLDAPSGTTILGAAKITGKLADHWNVATLHSFTQREFADVSAGGSVSHTEIEPAAYYGVARVQREFPDNRYGVGLIGTYAQRSFDDPQLRDDVNAAALTGGVDGWAFLGAKKTWVVTGWTGASQVKGNATRLTALQEGAQHYFQRPDATHVELDPNATSLSGWAGRFALNKEKGNVMFNAAYGFITPGFDTSDLGFLFRADTKNGHAVERLSLDDAGALRALGEPRSRAVPERGLRGQHHLAGRVPLQPPAVPELLVRRQLRRLQPRHAEPAPHARRPARQEPPRPRVGRDAAQRRSAQLLGAPRDPRHGLRPGLGLVPKRL